MSLTLLPHASRLVIGCLIDAEEVQAICDDRIVSDGSENQQGPWVRVQQFPGRIIQGGAHYWLEQTLFQVDCRGAGGNDRKLAHDLAETCRAVLAQRLKGSVAYTIGSSPVDGVVSMCEVGGIADTYDEAFQPARPMSRFDGVLTAHPEPTVGS